VSVCLDLACGSGVRRHSAGWRCNGGPALHREMNRVWQPAVFQPLPHAGGEISEADTHVESFGDVLSDAGSTPAASTIRLVFIPPSAGRRLAHGGPPSCRMVPWARARASLKGQRPVGRMVPWAS